MYEGTATSPRLREARPKKEIGCVHTGLVRQLYYLIKYSKGLMIFLDDIFPAAKMKISQGVYNEN